MINSILNSVKKALGLDADYTEFDMDVMMHINSTFSTLQQLGVGPVNGFMIEDAELTWDSFLLGDNRLNMVKSYMYLSVRVLFDPPATSYVLTAYQEKMKEYEWRLNVSREYNKYAGTDSGEPTWVNEVIFDGGKP